MFNNVNVILSSLIRSFWSVVFFNKKKNWLNFVYSIVNIIPSTHYGYIMLKQSIIAASSHLTVRWIVSIRKRILIFAKQGELWFVVTDNFHYVSEACLCVLTGVNNTSRRCFTHSAIKFRGVLFKYWILDKINIIYQNNGIINRTISF